MALLWLMLWISLEYRLLAVLWLWLLIAIIPCYEGSLLLILAASALCLTFYTSLLYSSDYLHCPVWKSEKDKWKPVPQNARKCVRWVCNSPSARTIKKMFKVDMLISRHPEEFAVANVRLDGCNAGSEQLLKVVLNHPAFGWQQLHGLDVESVECGHVARHRGYVCAQPD